MSPEDREKYGMIARASEEAYRKAIGELGYKHPWHGLNEESREFYRRIAERVIEAYEKNQRESR